MDHHEQSHAPQKTFQLLLFLLRKLEIYLKTMQEGLFALDSKVIVEAAAITAVSSVFTIGIQQY